MCFKCDIKNLNLHILLTWYYKFDKLWLTDFYEQKKVTQVSVCFDRILGVVISCCLSMSVPLAENTVVCWIKFKLKT